MESLMENKEKVVDDYLIYNSQCDFVLISTIHFTIR